MRGSALLIGLLIGWSSVPLVSAASERHFVTLPPHAALPSESACASWVNETPTPETIAGNAVQNRTVPDADQIAKLRADGYGFGPTDSFTQLARVTGNYTGSTDMILRWAACKYGIDEDLARAQAWQESWWQQSTHGDKRTEISKCVQTLAHPHQPLNPPFSDLWGLMCENCCFQSWSIFQTKVYYAWMTWPMIRDSTAFAADYRLAEQRSCMEGYYNSFFEGRGRYADDIRSGELNRLLWGCIGMHYSGDWYDSGAIEYIQDVRGDLDHRRWLTPEIHTTGP